MMESLDHYLDTLKLKSMKETYQKESEESMKAGDSYEKFLYRLSEREVFSRLNRHIQVRIKKAQRPSLKTLDSFDFSALPTLDKKGLMSLMGGGYIEKAENILALGNSGTGKTHLAIALGMSACQQWHSVLFKTAAQLVHELTEAHDCRKFLSLQKRLKGYK